MHRHVPAAALLHKNPLVRSFLANSAVEEHLLPGGGQGKGLSNTAVSKKSAPLSRGPSVFETAHVIAAETVRNQIRPQPLDNPRIVVAVRTAVIQRRKAVPRARLLHCLPLPLIEFRL